MHIFHKTLNKCIFALLIILLVPFHFYNKILAQSIVLEDITSFDEEQKPLVLAKPSVLQILTIIEGSINYNIKNSDTFQNVFKSTYDFSINLTGSGFAVTGNGYIITNGSTIERSKSDIAKYAIYQTAEEMIKDDIVDSTWLSEHRIPNQTEVDKLYEEYILQTGLGNYDNLVENLHKNYFLKTKSIKLNDIQKKTYVQTELISPLKDIIIGSGNLAEVVENAYDGKNPESNIAIIKTDISNHPVNRIENSSSPVVGGTVYAIGYEPLSDFNYGSFLNFEDNFNSIVLQTTVLENSEDDDLYPLELSYNLLSPGALVFNSSYQVIGITSQTISEDNQIIIPFEGIISLLNDKGITQTDNVVTNKYDDALQEYQRACYSKAKIKFDEAKESYAYINGVEEFVNACNERISKGQDKCIAGFEPWMFIVAVGSILVSIGSVTLIILIKTFFRKKIDYSKQDYFK